MDLIEDEGGNAPEFTVSEISGAVKRVIEGEFGYVRVTRRGRARVAAALGACLSGSQGRPRGDFGRDVEGVASAQLQTQPEEGMEVIAVGRLTTFPGQSKYQIVIEDIRPAGHGRADGDAGEAQGDAGGRGAVRTPSARRRCPTCPRSSVW